MSVIIKMDHVETNSHLNNAIHYIMKEAKANGRTFSNVGVRPEDIMDTFMVTQNHFGRPGKRKGYHYKFSFSKDETINPDDALSFIKEWVNDYLGDNYDYVMSSHSDREHMHMHLIFNAVSREGKKYRYEKGDWEKIIKPLTNRLCKKYGTGFLKEKEEVLTKQDWKTIIQADMDKIIDASQSYEEFKDKMVTLGYQVREGVSQEHGVYLALKPEGKSKAVRTYQLDEGYMPASIYSRIQNKPVVTEDEIAESKDYQSLYTQTKGITILKIKEVPFTPYNELSSYQQYFVRKMLAASRLYHGFNSSMQIREQSKVALRKFEDNALLVCRYGLKSPKDVEKFRERVLKIKTVELHKSKYDKTDTHNKHKETVGSLKRMEKNLLSIRKENTQIVKKKTR